MAMNPARFAVFGHPIAHSLSPPIHTMFGRQMGIPVDYQTIDAAPDEFASRVRQFFAAGGRGANVTLPHKRAAFKLADTHSAKAQRVGTANVLTPHAGGHIDAHNTDGDGMVRDLTERHQIDLRDHDMLLLGAGGAAQGIVWSLLDAGVAHITIVNRTPERAEALVDRIGDPARVSARYWEDLATIGSYDLIVNATSAGISGKDLTLPFGIIGARATCYDLRYGMAATGFTAWAKAGAARHVFDGLGMLVETSADAFQTWHGKRPDTDPVYAKLRGDIPLDSTD